MESVQGVSSTLQADQASIISAETSLVSSTMARNTKFTEIIKAIERAKRRRDDHAMFQPFCHLLHGLRNEPEATSEYRHVYEKMDGYFRTCVEKILCLHEIRPSLVFMGDMHRIFGNEAKALEYHERFWEFLVGYKYLEQDPKGCLDKESEFLPMMDIYFKNMKLLQKVDNALKNFDKALNIFERSNLPRKKEYIRLLHLKGLALYELENYEESLKVLKRGFKLMKKSNSPNDSGITDICCDIGHVQSKLGRSDLAIEQFHKVLEARTKNFDTNEAEKKLRVKLSFYIAMEYFGQNKHSECLEFLNAFTELYDTKWKLDFRKHAKDVSGYLDECYKALNKYNLEPFLYDPKTIEQDKKIDTLISRGVGFLRQRRFQEALPLLQKGLKVKMDIYHGKPPLTAQIYLNISVGRCLQNCLDFFGALEYVEFALNMFIEHKDQYDENPNDEVHGLIPDIYFTQSCCYYAEGYNEECIAATKEALALDAPKPILDENRYRTYNSMIGFGYFEKRQYGEAFIYLRRSKNLIEQMPRLLYDARVEIMYLMQMIKCKTAKEKYEEALNFLMECQELLSKVQDPDFHIEQAQVLFYRSICLRKTGTYAEACILAGKAVNLLVQKRLKSTKEIFSYCLMNKSLCSALVQSEDLWNDMSTFFVTEEDMEEECEDYGPSISNHAMKSALNDEDVDAFISLLQNTLYLRLNLSADQKYADEFARHISSARLCQFFRIKQRYI